MTVNPKKSKVRRSDEQRQDFQRCLPDTNSCLRPLTSLQSSASVPADFGNLVSLNQHTGSLSARFQRRFYPPTKTHSQPHQKQTSGRFKSPWEVKVQAADTRNTQRNSATAKMFTVRCTTSTHAEPLGAATLSELTLFHHQSAAALSQKHWWKCHPCLQMLQLFTNSFNMLIRRHSGLQPARQRACPTELTPRLLRPSQVIC